MKFKIPWYILTIACWQLAAPNVHNIVDALLLGMANAFVCFVFVGMLVQIPGIQNNETGK